MSPTAGPTFLVIGAARSGTTFLTRHLGRHPDIAITDPKEPHFLAYPGRRLDFGGPGDDETINRLAVTDADRWLALFDPRSPQRGEGSVSTLYRAETAVEAIREHCPDVRLVAVLRDPTARAHSAWLYQTGRGFETLDFDEALDAEPDRIASGWHHLWHYEAMGHYATQLEPFLEAFGADRLLVLDADDLRADPAGTLDRCFAHLGVASIPLGGLDVEVNQGGVPRHRTVARAMRWARRTEPVRRAVTTVVPAGVRERIRSADLDRPVIDPDAAARLQAAYEQDRAALRRLLGDAAPGWTAR